MGTNLEVLPLRLLSDPSVAVYFNPQDCNCNRCSAYFKIKKLCFMGTVLLWVSYCCHHKSGRFLKNSMSVIDRCCVSFEEITECWVLFR